MSAERSGGSGAVQRWWSGTSGAIFAGAVSLCALAGAVCFAKAAGQAHAWDTAYVSGPALALLLSGALGWRPGAGAGAFVLVAGYAAGVLQGASGSTAPLVGLCCWLAAEASVTAHELRSEQPFTSRIMLARLRDTCSVAAGSTILGVTWQLLARRPLPEGLPTEVAGLAAAVGLVALVAGGTWRWRQPRSPFRRPSPRSQPSPLNEPSPLSQRPGRRQP